MRLRSLLVFIVFVVLTVALTWPMALHLDTAVEDKLDALLNTWILAWEGHQLLTDPLALFDANIFYPYRNTLAFSEVILPQALLALPITSASGNPILGYNLALLASFALSGFAAYLLVLRLTSSRWAGLAAGVIFAFNAYKMSNLAQAQLLVLQWLPLALLYAERTLLSNRDTRRNAVLLALFVVLQALSSFYYAILALLAVALCLLVTLVRQRRRLRWQNIGWMVAALAASGMAIVPFVLPYVRVESELGFRRAIEESQPFSASLVQYVQALAGNVLYGRLAPSAPVIIGGYPLDALFPGLAVLTLAMAGLVIWRRRPQAWVFAAALTVLAFMLSLGPVLFITPGRPASLPLTMPYSLLYTLPGMQALRAPVRFAALVFLGLSILAGLGVAALSSKSPSRDSKGRHRLHESRSAVGLVAVAFLAAEAITVPAATISAVPTATAIPPVYRWLAQQQPGVILELPMIAASPQRGLLNQYFSIYHWHTTPDGYSGFIPPKHGEVAYEMQSFPSERALSLLQGLDVRYLIVHSDLMPDWPQSQALLTSFSAAVSLVRQFDNTQVYAIAPGRTSNALTTGLYLPASARPEEPYVASLVVTTQQPGSVVTKPHLRLHAEAIWTSSNGETRRQVQRATLPIVISRAAVVSLAFPSPGEGSYILSVKITLPDGSVEGNTRSVTVQRDALPQAQALPVRLSAASFDKESYRPGEDMQVKLAWQALGKIDAYYSIFVRLLDKNGQAAAQRDGQPANATRPTLLWIPGETIDDAWTLTIPESTPPGRYTLEAGIYRPQDLSPRLTLDGNGQPVQRLLLGSVRVAQPLTLVGSPALPLTASLGDRVALTGMQLEGCTWVETTCLVHRGGKLTVSLYWLANGALAADYSVFVHLAGSDGVPLAQHDGQPQDGRYPTSVWQRGDIVADAHELALGAGLPPGEYRLMAGLYDPITGLRLGTPGADSVQLATIILL